MRLVVAALLMLLLSVSSATDRDRKQRAAFLRENPCPANGRTHGACPGFVVDHIKPLCDGGVDRPANMQWQTVAEAKIKDKQEWRTCRERRGGG